MRLGKCKSKRTNVACVAKNVFTYFLFNVNNSVEKSCN